MEFPMIVLFFVLVGVALALTVARLREMRRLREASRLTLSTYRQFGEVLDRLEHAVAAYKAPMIEAGLEYQRWISWPSEIPSCRAWERQLLQMERFGVYSSHQLGSSFVVNLMQSGAVRETQWTHDDEAINDWFAGHLRPVALP